MVRLGPAVDDVLNRHNYPVPIAKLLGEAIVLTVMLGSALKIEGRLILQTSTDGPVRMLVVDFTAPDKVRACARFDAARVETAGNDAGKLLGHGHLAMTIDQGRRRTAIRAWSRSKAAISKRRHTSISPIPSRSPPGCGLRWRKNSTPPAAGRNANGAPAASCCNFCRRRRSACALPI